MEYRDIHNSTNQLEKTIWGIEKSTMSKEQITLIKKFVRELELGKAGSKVKDRRICLYLQFLTRLNEYFEKDLITLTEKETTKFYEDLQNNKIHKMNGMPYAQASKDEFVKALKRFLGWHWGKASKKYHKCIRWMKEDYKKSDKTAISLKDVEKVLKFKDNSDEAERNRCLFMFLFDSGARIEEALNVTFEDLKISKKGSDYFIVHLRGQKTEEADRTIPIPLTTKYLNVWIKKHPTGEGFIFPIQYDNARKIIRILSERALNIAIKPHELRHSSCTHYIQFGGFGAENIGGFYYRYGWRFGSDQALTYIKTHMYGGEAGHEKVVKHIVADRIETLEKEIETLNKELSTKITQEDMTKLFSVVLEKAGVETLKEMEKITKENLKKSKTAMDVFDS